MKPLFTTICAAWLLGAAAAVLGGQTSAQADKLLEAARHKEMMEGDLKTAIEQYRKIAAQFAKKPEIAARALFQLGQCQEKLGQAEARRSYERIVKEYSGAQFASAARARLVALGVREPNTQQLMRAVWTGPKVDPWESSLSPDGRFISFPDWDTGNLALHDLITGEDRVLTTNGTTGKETVAGSLPVYAEGSAISRDGRQVAYAWYEDKTLRYELRILNLSGDPNPRRIFTDPDVHYLIPRDWSPDGKWVVADLWNNATQTSRIGLIGVQDGSLHTLQSGSNEIEVGSFSPDGKYLLYSRVRPGKPRAYILSADGKSEVPLTTGTFSVEWPAWTPDGARILFVSDRSGSPSLWAVRVSDGKPVGEPELLRPDFNYTRALGFSRDGSLFYGVGLDATDIFVAGLDPATGRLTSEPKRINERVGRSWGRISWLPDGKTLCYWNREPIGALVEHSLVTDEEREIWGGKSGRPSYGYTGWFPDGRTVMARENTPQSVVFRRIDRRTGEAQASWAVPALPGGSSEPAYSPDLMTMYFGTRDQAVPCEGLKCAYIMIARDIQTGNDHELFRTTGSGPWRTSISPDGTQMVLLVPGEPGPTIVVASTAGGAQRKLYESSVPLVSAVWARDGRHVLSFRQTKTGGELLFFPIDGGSPEKSTLHIHPSEMPAISPDGKQIAFVGRTYASEIWMMSGFLKDTPAR